MNIYTRISRTPAQLFPYDTESVSSCTYTNPSVPEQDRAAKVIQDWWAEARFQIYQAMYDDYSCCQVGKIVGNPLLTCSSYAA